MKRVFLNLDTVDTLDQIIFLLCVSVLCIVGYLASFLACMGYMPVALPQLGQLKYLQRLPALLPLSPAWLGPTDTKLWKVRCLQSSAAASLTAAAAIATGSQGNQLSRHFPQLRRERPGRVSRKKVNESGSRRLSISRDSIV